MSISRAKGLIQYHETAPCVFRTIGGEEKSLSLLTICYKMHKIHFSKCRNTSIIIVLYSVLIIYGNGTSCHYCLFITITVCHVISLAPTKARKQLSTRTPHGLVSGLLALLTHKTYVLSIYCCGRKFARGSG